MVVGRWIVTTKNASEYWLNISLSRYGFAYSFGLMPNNSIHEIGREEGFRVDQIAENSGLRAISAHAKSPIAEQTVVQPRRQSTV